MKSWLGCIGLVAAVAVLTSVACSEDSGGSGGTGGTGGAGGGGTGGGGTDASTCSAADDGGGADVDLGPGTVKQCVTIYDADKIPYTASTVPVYTCTCSKSTVYPTGPNACRNDNDCSIINTGMVRELVRNCALPCRQHEPAPGVPESDRIAACNKMADCNSSCVKMATNNLMPPGLTDTCGKCYTEVALCSIAECLMQCAANADAIECIKCQFEKGCRVPYERCSGLDRQL